MSEQTTHKIQATPEVALGNSRLRVLVNDFLLEVQCVASQLAVVDFFIDAFAAL
jgi:hypothetical protein